MHNAYRVRTSYFVVNLKKGQTDKKEACALCPGGNYCPGFTKSPDDPIDSWVTKIECETGTWGNIENTSKQEAPTVDSGAFVKPTFGGGRKSKSRESTGPETGTTPGNSKGRAKKGAASTGGKRNFKRRKGEERERGYQQWNLQLQDEKLQQRGPESKGKRSKGGGGGPGTGS